MTHASLRLEAIRCGIRDAQAGVPMRSSRFRTYRQREDYRRAWLRTDLGLSHAQLRIEWRKHGKPSA